MKVQDVGVSLLFEKLGPVAKMFLTMLPTTKATFQD